MNNITIAFIGGGNMASSLIGGLITDGWNRDHIRVSEPDKKRCETLLSQFNIHSSDSNSSAVQGADIVVLAVKPQVLGNICKEIAPAVAQQKCLLISIAAGIRESDMRRWLGGDAAIVRAMPNTPALVQSGATGMIANDAVNQEQRNLAETVLRAVGLTLWLEDESLMDAVTALSGSGPAYFFLVMEAMEQAGIAMGLSAENAHLLTLQTAFGAAKMALESTVSTATLREHVTSPGGTTERAIQSLEEGHLRKLFQDALLAAQQRSAELAEQLGSAE
jgi:pyrroline-5-carboxylate reductase